MLRAQETPPNHDAASNPFVPMKSSSRTCTHQSPRKQYKRKSIRFNRDASIGSTNHRHRKEVHDCRPHECPASNQAFVKPAKSQDRTHATTPNGTNATSVQNADGSAPIKNSISEGVTRYTSIGPNVYANSMGISRESKRDSASAAAPSSLIVMSIVAENCMCGE